MRILVGWDDPVEADLIALYLNVSSTSATVTTNNAAFLAEAERDSGWDGVLLPTSTPDAETAWQTFCRVQQLLPDVAIVGACRTDDVFRVARFMRNGMRTFLIRDPAGDFMFLLQVVLESSVEAVRAERERFVSEKLREEIEAVRKLQQSIIPRDLPRPAGYGMAARYESSQIRVFGGRPVTLAGGDYYDVFMLNDNTTVLLLGDASGHGMRACMSIMTMHTLVGMIRNNEFRDTAAFVSDVNRRLCEQAIVQDEGGFITLLYAVLRTDTHELEWTSAGHPVPLLHRLATNEVEPLGSIDDGGLPLGIIPDAEYDVHKAALPARSRLLIYTDGLEDAFPCGDHDHASFGREGIERSLKRADGLPLDEALNALFADSAAFTAGAGRHDDTSVVLAERR
ncbi:MAG TPA: PP2C family protein-serine/threonine phosphatase [Planctomycetaceae bacterium]|nr:PP2C family protein-serine/threonine phosphatase [Planctomycetaceae bacterium]